jgi:glycoside/pentoside/hexuronide:cation symporter, GPH family
MASPQSARIGWLQLISYVLPSLALAAVGMPLVVHLPQFYASKEVGLSLAVTGTVFMICRVLDVFIDPTMGYFSDRWRTRWGRRRPMLAIGAPILALGIWMVFVPGGHVGPGYLVFWLMLMYVGWSMTIIPHLSWGSELSPDYHERSRIYGWSQAMSVGGMVLVLVLPAILEHSGVSSRAVQIMGMAVFSVVTLIPSVVLCLWVVPEPQVKLKTHAALWPTLKFLIANRAMRTVMAVDLIESINQGARGATFFFFAIYALAVPRSANTLLLVYFVTGVVFIPAWIALSRRIGKHRALIASFAFGCAMAPLMFFIPPGNTLVATLILGLTGVTYGAPAFLIRSMMADVADADAAENDAERAGLMYSFLSLTAKLGFGIAVGITFFALSWIGFDPKAAHPAATAVEHLRVLYIGIPILLGLISLATTIGYPIGEIEQRRLRATIERRQVQFADLDEATLVPGHTLAPEPGTAAE